jgi:hypothetical protein
MQLFAALKKNRGAARAGDHGQMSPMAISFPKTKVPAEASA